MTLRATWAQKQFKYKNTSRFPSSPLPLGLALPASGGSLTERKPGVLQPLTCEHRGPGGQAPLLGSPGAVPITPQPTDSQAGKFLALGASGESPGRPH